MKTLFSTYMVILVVSQIIAALVFFGFERFPTDLITLLWLITYFGVAFAPVLASMAYPMGRFAVAIRTLAVCAFLVTSAMALSQYQESADLADQYVAKRMSGDVQMGMDREVKSHVYTEYYTDVHGVVQASYLFRLGSQWRFHQLKGLQWEYFSGTTPPDREFDPGVKVTT